MTLADDLSSHLGDVSNVRVALRTAPVLSIYAGAAWAVRMYLWESRLLVCPFSLPPHACALIQLADTRACFSAPVDGGVWRPCDTFAAKALTWLLLSTDLSWPTGVKQTQTHIDCVSDHLFLCNLFIFCCFWVMGVKERDGTEASQSADVATSYFSSHRKKTKKVYFFDSGAFCLLLILFTKLTFSTVHMCAWVSVYICVCMCSHSTDR